ncbi:MAG: carboxypeptidase regulatory-like domain-containing protein [Pirellulaceae bacterium]|nr:carboxypeptidase regulatory-like domain-containing protein [Pirellulaceae bacterium]
MGKTPIRDATVVLHPVTELSDEAIRPRALTDADGKFRLTTYKQHDGAPAGEYRVTIQKWTTDKPDEGPKNRLNPKLAVPETSGLTATIQDGENKLQDFKISK